MLSQLFKAFGSEKRPSEQATEPGSVKNILIVRQHNQLGDMLCSVPLFAAVRKKYPGSHITLVASPVNYEILLSDINPYIDKVITYRKASATELRDFYSELRHHDYQIGIVPSTVSISRTSHFINYFSGAKVRAGVSSIDQKINKTAYLLNVKSDFLWDPRKLHQVDRNLEVGALIGCRLSPEEISNVNIRLSDSEIEFGRSYIRESFGEHSASVLSFHPGAGKIPNRWSTDNFISVISDLYKKHQAGILITSGTIDKPVTEAVANGLNSLSVPFKVLENTPIRKVAAVIKNTCLYITNDTGTMHVAGGVDANVLSLFGPTHGYEWAPRGTGKIFIQSPTENINDIKAEQVIEQAENLLKENVSVTSKSHTN